MESASKNLFATPVGVISVSLLEAMLSKIQSLSANRRHCQWWQVRSVGARVRLLALGDGRASSPLIERQSGGGRGGGTVGAHRAVRCGEVRN